MARSISDHAVVQRARSIAEYWHRDQTRKYTGYSYATHCERVASLSAMACPDPEVVAAAWLHDVLEDTECHPTTVRWECGVRVLEIVIELTDVSKPEDGNRAKRKEIDRERLAGVSDEAQTVKLADLVDNAMSIGFHDPNFAKVFLIEKKALLEVLTRGDRGLHEIASRLLTMGEQHLMDCVQGNRVGKW